MGCVCKCVVCDEHGNFKEVGQFSLNSSKRSNRSSTRFPQRQIPSQGRLAPQRRLPPQILVTSETDSKPPSQHPLHLTVSDHTQLFSNTSIRSVNQHQTQTSPPFDHSKKTVLKGELKKYRPGITHQFVSRWCQLTLEEFSYFKTQYSAECWMEKPLAVIPIIKIEKAQKVQFNTVEKTENSSNYYQFELFLKEEDEMVPVARKTEETPIKTELILQASVMSPQESVESGKLMKRPLRGQRNLNEGPKNTPADRRSWTHREVEWFVAEKRLLFSAGTASERDQWVNTINKLLSN